MTGTTGALQMLKLLLLPFHSGSKQLDGLESELIPRAGLSVAIQMVGKGRGMLLHIIQIKSLLQPQFLDIFRFIPMCRINFGDPWIQGDVPLLRLQTTATGTNCSQVMQNTYRCFSNMGALM